MIPEIKAKWLEALRSGEYRQAQEKLRKKEEDSVGYCCLGVLCDISNLGKWEDEEDYIVVLTPEEAEQEGYDSFEGGELQKPPTVAAAGELPLTLLKRFQISPDAQTTLVAMNDGITLNGQHTPPQDFTAIAQWIEENL